MIVLAIETSTPRGTVALVECTDGPTAVVLAEESFASARSHNALLFAPLQRLLQQGPRPDRVVVGTGPGSYTGIRIGIAAAHGLALALVVPWSGWPSLAALDDAPRYHVLGNARRGEAFLQRVENGELSGEALLFPEAEIADRLAGLDGPVFTTDLPPIPGRVEHRDPSAVRLALRAADFPSGSGVVEPIYLRAPYITSPKPPAGRLAGA